MDIKSGIVSMIANQSISPTLELICPHCKGKQYTDIEVFGIKKRMRCSCPCEAEKDRQKEKETKDKEKQLRLESMINNSLMDAAFKECTFENWDFKKGDKSMYNLGIKYTERFQELKKIGAGLLIYGHHGNGKTYLSCCIANRLLQNYVPVMCMSINSLLALKKASKKSFNNEDSINALQKINNADLLIIDDLGTEDKWDVGLVHEILDDRIRTKLPLIITTNMDINPKQTNGLLAEKYGKRTEDRIFQMCTPILNPGQSLRIEEARDKAKALRNILGGN